MAVINMTPNAAKLNVELVAKSFLVNTIPFGSSSFPSKMSRDQGMFLISTAFQIYRYASFLYELFLLILKFHFDSIIENSRQRITTEPIAKGIGPKLPCTVRNGTNAATVVSTPKVAGIATRLAPRMTLSRLSPSRSVAVCTLSPIMIASSTTIPSTRIKPKILNFLYICCKRLNFERQSINYN